MRSPDAAVLSCASGRKGRPYGMSSYRSVGRGDHTPPHGGASAPAESYRTPVVGAGFYPARRIVRRALVIFVGGDAHAVERSGTSTLGVHRPAQEIFRASGHGTLLAAVPKVSKRTASAPKEVPLGENPGFWTSCTLFLFAICHRLPRARGTWSFSFRMTYRLAFLRRCRSCASTVGDGSLYGGAMWASPPTEFYRRLAARWCIGSLFPSAHTIGAQCPSPYRISGSGAGAETIRS